MPRYIHGVAIALLLCLTSLGCRTPRLPNELHAHAIAIDRDGKPYDLPARSAPQLAAVYPDGEYSFAGHLGFICQSIKENPDDRELLFFVHGGLLPLATSFESGRKQAREILRDGKYYPIFIDWESGIRKAYMDHLLRVRDGYDTRWAAASAPLVALADVGRAVGRIPYLYASQIAGWFRSWGEYEYEGLQRELAARQVPTSLAYLSPDRPSTGRRVCDIVQFFIPGIPAKAITTPVMDTAGKAGWNNMVRRAKSAVHAQRRYRQPEANPEYLPADGAAIELVRELCRSLPADVRFTFVGHSMGSIVVNEILEEIQRDPELKCLIPRIDRVVYLAAACSVRDFHTSVLPLLDANPKTEFYNLCLHPYAEENEKSFSVDVLPRGSLLEYLDRYVADPETFESRRMGKWANAVRTISTFPTSLQKRIHIKGFGFDDHDPQKHGDMDNGPYWRKEFLEPPAAPAP